MHSTQNMWRPVLINCPLDLQCNMCYLETRRLSLPEKKITCEYSRLTPGASWVLREKHLSFELKFQSALNAGIASEWLLYSTSCISSRIICVCIKMAGSVNHELTVDVSCISCGELFGSNPEFGQFSQSMWNLLAWIADVSLRGLRRHLKTNPNVTKTKNFLGPFW